MGLETPFFFRNATKRLFGIIHDPSVRPLSRGFVFCHPFAEEKLWTHRVHVNFARCLTALGFHVLRFDYMGHGDSEGQFSDTNVETRLADIDAALDWLKGNRPVSGGLGLLGLRFGATLACLTAEKRRDLQDLILWEPILQGAKHMKEMLRFNITTQSAVYKEIRFNSDALVAQMQNGQNVSIDGYDICWPLYQQISAIDLTAESKTFSGRVLAVQINRREGQGTDRLQALVDLYPKGAVVMDAIEEPFWKEIKRYYAKAENLFNTTEKWLRSA